MVSKYVPNLLKKKDKRVRANLKPTLVGKEIPAALREAGFIVTEIDEDNVEEN